jgi:hypothetical protein
MINRAKLKTHAALFDRAAQRLGIDLQSSALSGDIRVDEIGDAVLQCSHCPNPLDCRHWLDRNECTASAPPVYCPNAALMIRLRDT